ncbi:MAG: ATP-binding cassette domain-containing protein [Bifidobacteriaceae bacterium]|nr:ATP-binding cassette domain-containing protein [Bifidobacteriaceae bacterium]
MSAPPTRPEAAQTPNAAHSSPPGPIIETHGLVKRFGDVTAVAGIDFAVRPGELFAFLGPNGAGKSTTVNLLCTLIAPDGGTARVAGLDVVRDRAKVKRRIGVVFQEHVLDPRLTVGENLMTRGAFYHRGPELAAAVARAAEAAAATDLLDRRYGKLSGGQMRRADIARALLNTPDVLFLDEPTTGLDPQTRRHVWDAVTRLRREAGMTIFLTTHYMEEAAEADHVVIVDHGRVVAEGTPETLKERYVHDELRLTPADPAGFLGALTEAVRAEGLSVTFPTTDDGAARPGREGPPSAVSDGGTPAGGGVAPRSARSVIVREGGTWRVPLPGSLDAIGLLNRLAGRLQSFEVVHGSMDDVFLAVTGEELRDK